MNISIVVPTYNRKEYLTDCLQALFNQTYPKDKYEIIIVDDGSTDETRKMIEEMKRKNLHYFYQKNSGPAIARNLGIKNSQSEIIVFIDDDCVARKNWLVNLTKDFNKNQKVAGIGGKIRGLKPKNLIEKYCDLFLFHHKQKIEKKGSNPPYLATGNCAYRAKIIKKVGFFDSVFRQGEDVDLSWRIYFLGYQFLYRPEAIVFHQAPKTLTQLLQKKFIQGRGITKVIAKHQNNLEKLSNPPVNIFRLFINSLLTLFNWPKRILALYNQLPRQYQKEKFIYLLIPILNILTYRTFRLGMIYQAIKMERQK